MRLGAIIGLLVLPALVSPATAASRGLFPAPPEAAATIAVRIHGVRSSDGRLVVVLYGDNAENFLRKGGRLARQRVPASNGTVMLELPAPGPGRYAVAVYHDENGNGKLDRAMTGLPSEGVGLSNNPRLWLRVPRLADAAFEVGDRQSAVDIVLRY